MTRNQIFTTLEFINDTVRLVLGEYYNDKFYVYDVFESKCAGLNRNEIVDEKLVIDAIKQIRDTIHVKHDILIEEVILSLPSDKLNILAFTSSSPVTGRNSLISQQDINEAYKVAYKVRHREDEKIISVVPIEYYLDTGEKMDFAPIRYRSSTFKILFNVLLLPNNLFEQYMGIVSSCNLRVNNYFLDSECLYSGIFEEGDINCGVLNLNKFTSSITMFKRGKLLNYYKVDSGSYLIEEILKEKHKVKENDINRVAYVLANGNLEDSSKRAIYKNDEYESYKYLNQYEVDEVVNRVYKDVFNNLYGMCKETLDRNIYDVYLSGKASCISNLDKYFSFISGCNASVVTPSHLCLNNPSFLQTIGLIRLNYKKIIDNKALLENNQIAVETKESKFDKFILDEDELS